MRIISKWRLKWLKKKIKLADSYQILLKANFIIWFGDEVVNSNVAPILEVVRIIGDVNPTSESVTTIQLKVIENIVDNVRERVITIPYTAITKKDLFYSELAKRMVFVNYDYVVQLQRYLNGQIRLLRMMGRNYYAIQRTRLAKV